MYMTSFRLLPLLLLALLAACDRGPGLSPLDDDAVILAFGDSLTRGTGADEGEGYPAVLERLSGRRVINAGVPGELSAEGRERLPGILERERPDLLILCHGGNDILRGRDADAAADNLAAMIRMARERGVQVMLIGVPERNLVFHATADFYHRVAEETDAPLESEAMAHIIGEPSLKSDQIHPNAAGYRHLAEAIHELLRETGAL